MLFLGANIHRSTSEAIVVFTMVLSWLDTKKQQSNKNQANFDPKKAKPPNDYYSPTVDAILCRNCCQILRIDKICGSSHHRRRIRRVIVFLGYWIPTLFWGCTTQCTCLASDKGPELSAFLNGLEWCVWYNTAVNTFPNGKELNNVENIKKQFNYLKVTFNEHLVSESSLKKPL